MHTPTASSADPHTREAVTACCTPLTARPGPRALTPGTLSGPTSALLAPTPGRVSSCTSWHARRGHRAPQGDSFGLHVLLPQAVTTGPCCARGPGLYLRDCAECLAARSDVPHDADFGCTPPPPPPRYSDSWSDDRGLAKRSGCATCLLVHLPHACCAGVLCKQLLDTSYRHGACAASSRTFTPSSQD